MWLQCCLCINSLTTLLPQGHLLQYLVGRWGKVPASTRHTVNIKAHSQRHTDGQDSTLYMWKCIHAEAQGALIKWILQAHFSQLPAHYHTLGVA